MNKKFLSIALIGIAFAMNAKDNDPVLMTVDGRDVKLSEFEYLYNKNNSQQIEPMTFEQYVDMFVDYKLKVADALAAGIDTTEAFTKEFVKFRNELAEPYLRDPEKLEELINDAYSHFGSEVFVSHIMLPPISAQNPNSEEKCDSIRKEILAGNITFENAARKYSTDRASSMRGGKMGWVIPNSRYPWAFEKAVYDTPPMEISEVVNSGFGYHLVRPEMRRRPRGQVSAQHILLMTRNMDEAAVARQKAKIDSLYQLAIAPGADFSDLARRFSDDTGSAKNGGDLGWFDSGRMVEPFDSIAFALPEGEVSEPFLTTFGYHIVKNTGHRSSGNPSLDEVRPEIKKAIENDSRSQLLVKATIDKYAAKHGFTYTPDLGAKVMEYMQEKGLAANDSAMTQAIAECPIVAFVINGKSTTVGQCFSDAPLRPNTPKSLLPKMVNDLCMSKYDTAVLDLAREDLSNDYPEYRNLVNEYRDGILLFEISNRNVWERASNDTEGLEQYFQAHRDKYVWDAPKYKGMVIFATNDSILGEVKEAVKAYDPATVNYEDFSADLKKKFGRNVKVERVIAAKGENAITVYLGFGGKKPDLPSTQRLKSYFAYGDRVINAPEEVSDVKGQVVSDYQAQLEQDWLKQLRKKYKVSINQKALKKAK